MLASSQLDPMLGIDIHWELVPMPAPTPLPIPNPFTGIVFDPIGLVAGLVISNAIGMAMGASFKGPVMYWGAFPASNTGTEGKHIPGHILIPPGTAWAPVPRTPKPTIHPGEVPTPPKPVTPDNDAVIVFGSKTVTVMGSNAVRLGDMAMSCSEPIRLPSSVVLAVPKGAPILIGGPPSLDLMAALLASLRTRFVSDSLHALLSRMRPSRFRNLLSRVVCFFTGHPVDVATGKVMTDAVEVSLPGPIPLQVERVYSSAFASREGPLGHGWSLSLDQSVWVERGKVVYLAGDGREIEFDTMGFPDRRMRPGDEVWNPIDRLTLRREAEGRWKITQHDGVRHEFGPVPGDRRSGRARLLRTSSRCGNHEVVYGYGDQDGRLEWVRDSGGRVLKLAHDAQGRVTELLVPDARGWTTHRRYRYDEAGDLVEVTDAAGHSWRFEYVTHLLVRETDRAGLSFYFTYDGLGEDAWCTRTWGDGGIHDHVIRYDKKNHVTFVTNSLGHTTTYFANAAGAVVKVVDALGKETKYEYDEAFRRTAVIDPLGNATRSEYDARGNRTRVTGPDGATVSVEYDAADLPVRAVDAIGGEWRWINDAQGRLIEEVNAAGGRKRYEYEEGLLSAYVDPSGLRMGFSYDRNKNLAWVERPNGAKLRFDHDRRGRRVYHRDARGAEWRIAYDEESRPVKVETPIGDVLRKRYDAEGNLIEVGGAVRRARFGYQGFYRRAWYEEDGARVTLRHDTEGRLTGVVNEAGELCSFTLDPLGRVIREEDFDGASRSYTYDGAGRLLQVTNPDGTKDALEHDAAGRLTERRHGDGTFRRFRYRPDGAVIAAENETGVVAFDRDGLGRVVREIQGEHVVASQYAGDGFRSLVETSLGGRQAILRDPIGEVQALHLGPGSSEQPTIRFDRDEAGFELTRHLPGGVRIDWERDRAGRPTSRRTSRRTLSGHDEVRSLAYRWGGDGQLLELADSATGPSQYTFDPRGRLVREERPDAVVHRATDAAGNVYRTPSGRDRRYGRGGRLEAAGGATYEHDANGNLIRKLGADGAAWRYHWTGGGLLREVERPDGLRVRFEYDALARRTRKATLRTGAGGEELVESETRFVWDGRVVAHELAGGAAPVTWYWEPESFTPVARQSEGQIWPIATDHLGVPTEMYDELGQVAWRMRLDPFGEPRFEQGSAGDCPWRWPGQYEDGETRLFYNWHRYYGSEEGRYLSKDPLGFRPGAAQFAYPADPLGAVDPLGLFFGSTTPVGYWTHDFQQELNQAYRSGEARVGGNVAVVELADGTRRTFASGGGLHSEQNMIRAFQAEGIQPSQIRRLYTELSPCLDRCLPELKAFLGDHAQNVHLEFTWVHTDRNPNRLSDQRVRCGG